MLLPFAIVLGTAILLLPSQRRSASAVFQTSLISSLWLLAFLLSGDRRLFFPFTLPLCVHLFAFRGLTASLVMVALFTCIRLLQAASWPVLAVELLVTVPALGVPLLLLHRSPVNPSYQFFCAGLCSLLAFAGLAF